MNGDLGRSDTRQVLYVEDNPLNAVIMEALFEERPHLDLHVATDAASAFELAPSLRPALLLLDLRLPDCMGTELLPLLRQRFHWQQIPAIAVTAESEFTLVGSGFAEVWYKPLDLRQVLRRLDHWVPAEGEWIDDRELLAVAGRRAMPAALEQRR